jgi:DNA-binding CsgD family transcriptional regulator
MDRERRRRVKRDIVRLCGSGLDARALFNAAADRISQVVAFDRACWHTFDPATLLYTSGFVHNLEPEPRLATYEYEIDDVNKFGWLARQAWPVGLLTSATHGHRQLSARFRDILTPRGIADELRVSFVADARCWGVAGLYRDRGRAEFTDDEAAFVAEIDAAVAGGLRRALLLDALAAPDAHPAAALGLVLLDRRGELTGANDVGTRLLTELPDDHVPGGQPIPLPVLAVATRARRAATGADATRARARARTRDGQWVVLHGTRLGDGPDGDTAVIIEPARPVEMAELILLGHGLTSREREITRLVLQGRSTAEIAATLHVSPYTVQDHLKAVFAKVGVGSRRELVATVFADHYAPHVGRGSPVGPDGYFTPGAADA